MRFTDRRIAGKLLAKKLEKYRGGSVVYALPRGGVEVGVEVARYLGAPLDLIISRKIGHPLQPEYAIGAVTETGPAIWNENEVALIDPAWLKKAESDERDEAKRRRKSYMANRKHVSARRKNAIIVDDGIATGLTMISAIQEIKRHNPKKVIIAVPVAPKDVKSNLLVLADQIITLDKLANFQGAVGAHFKSFPQLNDIEVMSLLHEAEEIFS